MNRRKEAWNEKARPGLVWVGCLEASWPWPHSLACHSLQQPCDVHIVSIFQVGKMRFPKLSGGVDIKLSCFQFTLLFLKLN